jgi:DNA-binding FadR family transcriptional regulator
MAVRQGVDRGKETLRQLRGRITSGEWPLNSKIPTEAELAVALGVGRSTVREAIQSLAAVGMLEPAPSRGTFVRSLTPVSGVLSDFVDQHTLGEVIEVRRALEIEACRLAASRRTEEDLAALREAHEHDIRGIRGGVVERGRLPGQFHAMLFVAAHNQLLSDLHTGVMSGLRSAINTGRATHGIDDAERHRAHAAILAAIEDGDAEKAALLAAEHAERDLMIVEQR